MWNRIKAKLYSFSFLLLSSASSPTFQFSSALNLSPSRFHLNRTFRFSTFKYYAVDYRYEYIVCCIILKWKSLIHVPLGSPSYQEFLVDFISKWHEWNNCWNHGKLLPFKFFGFLQYRKNNTFMGWVSSIAGVVETSKCVHECSILIKHNAINLKEKTIM